MAITERDRHILEEIEEWEEIQFQKRGTDFTLTYQKWINKSIQGLKPEIKKRMLTFLDDSLFQIQTIVQQSRPDQRALKDLLTEARVFRTDIYEMEDLKKLTTDQLRYIARKQLAKQNLTAFGQGGITGAGGLLVSLADLPLMLAINLRTIQLMAMTYGYDIRKPYEMMLVMKVFHAISLPRHLQGEAWKDLFEESWTRTDQGWVFYEGDEDIISQSWIQQPLKQITKLIILRYARKKLIQGIPIVGIAFGAGVNYSFAKQVSDASHQFYQKRRLLEKRETED